MENQRFGAASALIFHELRRNQLGAPSMEVYEGTLPHSYATAPVAARACFLGGIWKSDHLSIYSGNAIWLRPHFCATRPVKRQVLHCF